MKKILLLNVFLLAIISVFSFKLAPSAFASCAGPNGVTFQQGDQYCAGDSYPGNGQTLSSGQVCSGPLTQDFRTCLSTGSFSQNFCGSGSYCAYDDSLHVSCYAACAAPPPTPNCNTGVSCSGACSASCGAGTQSGCVYTSYSGGGSCNQVSAPNQSCTGTNCTTCTTCYTGCNTSCSSYTTSGSCSYTSCSALPSCGGFCGDGICGNSSGESCSTCSSDCGVCPPSPTPPPTGSMYSCQGSNGLTCVSDPLGGRQDPTCGGCTFHQVIGYVYQDLNGNNKYDQGEGYNGAIVDMTYVWTDGNTYTQTDATADFGGTFGYYDGFYGEMIRTGQSNTVMSVELSSIPGYEILSSNAVQLPNTNFDYRVDFKIAPLSGTATPTPTVPPISSLGNIFVTSTTYSPNLGGLSGADAKCQARADANSLGGTWKAWLSDDTTSAASRLIHSTSPYYRMDGVLVANNWTDLTDGTLAAPINKTELNTAPPLNSWVGSPPGTATTMTNTNPNGTLKAAGQSCNNWTSTSGSFYGGNANRSDSFWSYYFQSVCDPSTIPPHSLYCIKQDSTSPTPTATYTISGTVFNDTNRNGVQDAGETGYSGASLRLSWANNGNVRTTDASGNYLFQFLASDTYTNTLTVPAGMVATTANPRTVSVGPSTTINFGIAPAFTPTPTPLPASTGTIFVYNDLDGNGAQDPGENGLPNITVNITGVGAGTYTTNASGTVTLLNLPPGTSTITGVAPSGYTSTTTNPVTTSWPPSQTINIGMHPFPPTCTGLTANPTTVNPGQNSTLTVSGCPAGVTYTWPVPDYGTTVNVNNPVTTWNSPNPFYQDVFSHPSVQVCFPASGVCTAYGTQIHIVPIFNITGNVFVDQNKDQVKNSGEPNYSPITITSSGGTVTYPSSGTYNVSVTAGTYTVSYTSLPVGYQITYPLNGPPPSFTVKVGTGCSAGGSNSASCDVNGNIANLNYGITNSIPWIQSSGGDVTGTKVTDPSGGGFTDPIPSGASCGTYASVTGSGGYPGMIYSGAGSYDFGQGQASQNPYNWVVGGLTYPETYTPLTPGVIRTSYSYVSSIASQSNLTPIVLGTSQCGAGGISNCQLSGSLSNGLYIANGNLTLAGPSYNFPANKNFVILVNGNLNINTEIHVPVGSSAFFTVSGDIHVGNSVGNADITLTRSNVEGYYSADKNFYVDGTNTCPTSDLRLNVAGAVVVNAALGGGDFVNNRDLCAGDLQCPVFQIKERPDFILNSPDFLKNTRRVWQEIAP